VRSGRSLARHITLVVAFAGLPASTLAIAAGFAPLESWTAHTDAAAAPSCVPLPTCGDPGSPSTDCASPTPTIAWGGPACLTAAEKTGCGGTAPFGKDCPDDCYVCPMGTHCPIEGYRVLWRSPGGAWVDAQSIVLPCLPGTNSNRYAARFCPGREQPYPLQRLCGVDLETTEFTVRAYNCLNAAQRAGCGGPAPVGSACPVGCLNGESDDPVPMSLCMPHMWRPAEQYR
jgi:hypothetical protein